MSNTAAAAHTIIVIPCAAEKAEIASAARALYTSANFANTLAAAELEAIDTERVCGTSTKVMILSAKHGLIELDAIVAPYNTKMGEAGDIDAAAIAAQLAELAPSAIISLLPAAYRNRLAAAVAEINDDEDAQWIDMMDTYEDAPGIGYQRGVVGSLKRTHALIAA